MVEMNTQDKAKKILSDSSTYNVLTKDPTSRFLAQLDNLLLTCKKEGLADRDYKRLYLTSSVIPRFYGLPKVHKKNEPLRPIVAYRGSTTYKVAVFVAGILAPLAGNNGYSLKNSKVIVDGMKNIKLGNTDVLTLPRPLHQGDHHQELTRKG